MRKVDKNRLITVQLNLNGVKKIDSNRFLKIGSTKYFIRTAGDFIYGKQNLFNGAFGVIPIELDGFGTSGDVPSLKANEDLSTTFLVRMLSVNYKELEKFSSGTGSKRVHEDTLLEFIYRIPFINEQNKIVDLFSSLDHLITLHHRKPDP